MKKNLKRILGLLLIFGIVLCSTITAFAGSDVKESTYNGVIYQARISLTQSSGGYARLDYGISAKLQIKGTVTGVKNGIAANGSYTTPITKATTVYVNIDGLTTYTNTTAQYYIGTTKIDTMYATA